MTPSFAIFRHCIQSDETGTGKDVVELSTPRPSEHEEAPEVIAEVIADAAEAEAPVTPVTESNDVISSEGIGDVILPLVTSATLSPVDLIIENEIWQYRYPPFEDIVQSDEELALAATRARSNQAAAAAATAGLPDYVIGILNPSELIENIFRPVSDFFAGGMALAPPPLPLAPPSAPPIDLPDEPDLVDRFNAREDRWIWRG